MSRSVPSGLATTLTLAAITWKRLLRGRALWVGLGIAALPVVFASVLRASKNVAINTDLFGFEQLLLGVIPAMFVATAIGDEIEDRTTTYLWSRPIPRWSVVAGKLLTLAPLAMAIVVGSWFATIRAAFDATPTAESCVALAAGALVMSLIAAGMATLVPKHGMALTICYLLSDGTIGLVPASLRTISVTSGVRGLSHLYYGENSSLHAAFALVVIGVAWGALAVSRIQRIES